MAFKGQKFEKLYKINVKNYAILVHLAQNSHSLVEVCTDQDCIKKCLRINVQPGTYLALEEPRDPPKKGLLSSSLSVQRRGAVIIIMSMWIAEAAEADSLARRKGGRGLLLVRSQLPTIRRFKGCAAPLPTEDAPSPTDSARRSDSSVALG